MTQKELLYFEDAIKHESNIVSILNESLNNIEEKELESFINNEIKKHNSMKKSLINLLQEKSNE